MCRSRPRIFNVTSFHVQVLAPEDGGSIEERRSRNKLVGRVSKRKGKKCMSGFKSPKKYHHH